MRVENPRFDVAGDCYCADCPFEADEFAEICVDSTCPTLETYTEACALADAAKEGE